MTLKNHATLSRLDHLHSLQPSAAHTKEIESMITEQQSHLKEYTTDISTQAVLAALYSATSDLSHPTSSLPPISSFTKGINVNHLEAQGIPSAASVLVTKKPKSVSRPHKRRIRGGKVFDSSQQADPERWLPMRERNYKPSKSKRRKTGGAAQGSAVEGESMSQNGSAHQVETRKVDGGSGKKKKKGRK
jgi:SRP72 RNA-binding domain